MHLSILSNLPLYTTCSPLSLLDALPILPAILYFAGIWIMTHFEAKRKGLLGLPSEQIPRIGVVLKKIHLLLPILIIVVLLFQGFSIERTALYGILSTIVVSKIGRASCRERV